MPMPISRRQPVDYDTVKLVGGWDQLTPTLSLGPGSLRDVTNFEVSALPGGGYSRIAGYERFDGRARPSDASYSTVQISSFTNTPTVGQTLTGFTSGAMGVIVALGSNYMILTKVTGAFTNTEVVKVGGTTIGTAVPNTTVFTPMQDAQYTQAAADNYRADIGAVPGSGPVRGVVGLTVSGVEKVFAFRDNAGGTAGAIYEASSSGWTAVALLYEVSFTAGAVATPADGATLTQGGVTATVKRVCLQTGAWTGAGTGRLIITAPSGGNFAAGAASLTGGATCTLAGIQTAITISPGGRYQFSIGNLGGQAESVRAYGCDGVNRGFEFDGVTYAPIATGTSTDAPSAVAVHQKHIFFAFRSSVIHSGLGTPFNWSAAAGASEIAVGNTVTNFLTQPGTASSASLGVTTVDNYYTLYGTGVANWTLVGLNAGVGGIARTAQLLNQGYWLDDPGLINLRTSQNFGNFQTASLTQHINTFMTAQRSLVNSSVVHRGKSQYRVYFSDGQGLYATVANGKFLGATKVSFPNTLYCTHSAERSDFSERLYGGASSGGYVYELDRGSSFDGSVIEASMTFNWNFSRSPRTIKRYRKLSLEMQGNFYASINVGYALGYNTTERLQATTQSYNSGFSGVPRWDSFVWDAFTWDGQTLSPTEIQLRGSAENIQLTISSGTNYIQPFTVNSAIYNLSGRRGVR
jgi:hypothetical protein